MEDRSERIQESADELHEAAQPSLDTIVPRPATEASDAIPLIPPEQVASSPRPEALGSALTNAEGESPKPAIQATDVPSPFESSTQPFPPAFPQTPWNVVSPSPQKRRSRRRFPLFIGGALGLILLLLVLIIAIGPTLPLLRGLLATSQTRQNTPSVTRSHPTVTQSPTTPTAIPASPTVTSVSPTATQTPPHPIGTVLLTYGGHSNNIGSVAWSPDGTRIVTSSSDATAQVWNATTGERLLIYRGHDTGLGSVSWSPDGTQIASSTGDDQLLIWDAQTGATLLTYNQSDNQHFLGGVTWSPNGKYVAFYRGSSANIDNEIYVLDVNTQKLILSLPVTTSVMALAWSPDGSQLAYGLSDATVRILAVATGQVLVTYTGQKPYMYGPSPEYLAWSPNGKYIASSGGYATTVQVWDATTGNAVYTYTGHTAQIGTIAWSPDSKRIASSSGEQIQLWDALTGQHVFIYIGQQSWVGDLAWSPDGTRIVSVGGDNKALVWQAV